jgi:hypothetical protein
LNLKCKIYEGNKKTEKAKKKRKKNMKLDPGNPFGPVPQPAHGPLPLKPETVRSHPADAWTPPVRIFFLALTTPVTEFLPPDYFPLLILLECLLKF